MIRILFLNLFLISVICPLRFSEASDCPQRIVSVTLASDEILLDIVEDRERISAVTYLADDDSISNVVRKAKNIKKVHANLEQIVELEPDLVITADYLGSDFIKLLKSAGLNTMVLKEVKDVDSIKENIELLGKAVCEKENASKLVMSMEKKISEIKTSYKVPESRPEVLFYSAPGFTAGPDSLIDQLITIAGGENAFDSESFVRSSRISLEYIVEEDPDIIILSNFSPSDPGFENRFVNNPAIRESTAYKKDNIHVMEGRYIVSSSHYVVKGISMLAKLIRESS